MGASEWEAIGGFVLFAAFLSFMVFGLIVGISEWWRRRRMTEAEKEAEKEQERRKQELSGGVAGGCVEDLLAIALPVGFGLLVLYGLVRFVKWAWTD